MVEIAIKFCGGCNPTFDRVQYWERVRRIAADRVSWVRLREDHNEVVLLINGCRSACPEHDLPPTSRLVSVKNDETPPEEVVRILLDKEY